MKKVIIAVTIAAALFATSFADAQTNTPRKMSPKIKKVGRLNSKDVKASPPHEALTAHPHKVPATTKVGKSAEIKKEQGK